MLDCLYIETVKKILLTIHASTYQDVLLDLIR